MGISANPRPLAGLRAWAVVAVLAGVCGESPEAKAQEIFARWLSGADGFAEASRQHESNGKPTLVYFYTDWCPYCRRLNTNILASEEMDDYLDDVVAVRINPEAGARERALSKQFGVSGYPSIFVLPEGSDRPRSIHPYRRDGNQWVPMTGSEFVRACEQAGERPGAKRPTAPSGTPKAKRKRQGPSAPSASAAPARPAHDLGPQVTLHLKNGSIIDGMLVRETPDVVTLGWDYGEMDFQRGEIERLVDN